MYYIAYGSNLNLEQMAYRCPKSKPVKKAYLKGWKLSFNVHADVMPTGKKSDTVPVLLWDIHKDDWASLDRYEGYPKYYIKEKIPVYYEDGTTEDGIVYVMAYDRKGFEMPFERYYATIEKGYEENKIPKRYLWDAVNYTFENEE